MGTVSVTQHKPYTLVGSLGCPGYLASLSPVFTQLCVFLPLHHGSLEGSTALLYEFTLSSRVSPSGMTATSLTM